MALIWPNGSTAVPRVTSEFNPMRKHPVSGAMRPHRGIDLAGWRDIVSPVAGKVTTRAYQAGGAGNYVNITADNGDVFKFFHLASPSPLKVGQRVSPGTVIGVMGATGGVTGVHLHFEVWSGGKAVNPRTYYAQRQTGAITAEAAPRPREETDPMLYISGKNYVVLGHNGGWVSIAYTPNDPKSEYANLVKKLGEPVWVNPATLANLIDDSRGNANSELLSAVRDLVASEKGSK